MPLQTHELLELCRAGESETVEFKESFQKQPAGRTIAAFSNALDGSDRPRVLFIGIRDNGQLSDLTIDDSLQRTVADYVRSGDITPLPRVSIERLTIDQGACLAIVVQPYPEPPVYHKGDIFVRVGSTTRKASRDEEIKLNSKRRHTFFDVRPVVEATIKDDLDAVYLETEYIPSSVSIDRLADNDRSIEQKLQALRLVTKENQPTVCGILIGGKDPTYFLPGAYVQFRRVVGDEIDGDMLDEKAIRGRLRDVISTTLEKLDVHNFRARIVTNTTSEVLPLYPPKALRELVINAIVHRDYERSNAPVRITWFDHRVEIWNPGGPYGSVTEQNFADGYSTDYRNPHVTEALKNLGFVEKFGSGIPRVRRSMEENGNPPPQYEARADANYVLVTLKTKP